MEKLKRKISLPKVFRILSISCLIPVLFVVPYLHFIQPIDLFSSILGVVGLIITFYQLYQAAKSSEYSDLSKHIDRIEQDYLRELEEVKGHFSEKHDNHQQTINWLFEKTNQLSVEIHSHKQTPGHAYTIGDLAKIREELAELKAAIAIITKYGEMMVRIQNLESSKGGGALLKKD